MCCSAPDKGDKSKGDGSKGDKSKGGLPAFLLPSASCFYIIKGAFRGLFVRAVSCLFRVRYSAHSGEVGLMSRAAKAAELAKLALDIRPRRYNGASDTDKTGEGGQGSDTAGSGEAAPVWSHGWGKTRPRTTDGAKARGAGAHNRGRDERRAPGAAQQPPDATRGRRTRKP